MNEKAKETVGIDLNQFKLHVHLKHKPELTLHFDTLKDSEAFCDRPQLRVHLQGKAGERRTGGRGVRGPVRFGRECTKVR